MIKKFFKNKLARICIIAGFSLAGIATAQAQGACQVLGTNNTMPVCENVTIDRLMILDNGNVYVATSADESVLVSNNACTPLGGRYGILDKDVTGSERMLAVLITAHERRRPLKRLRFDFGSSGCTIQYIWSDM